MIPPLIFIRRYSRVILIKMLDPLSNVGINVQAIDIYCGYIILLHRQKNCEIFIESIYNICYHSGNVCRISITRVPNTILLKAYPP